MKTPEAESPSTTDVTARPERSLRSETLVPADASPGIAPPAATEQHVARGSVLWTLTKGPSTAEARRWITALGFELEVQIWKGPRVEGAEDLCWAQVFIADDALADTALSKKQQLEAAGWTEAAI